MCDTARWAGKTAAAYGLGAWGKTKSWLQRRSLSRALRYPKLAPFFGTGASFSAVLLWNSGCWAGTRRAFKTMMEAWSVLQILCICCNALMFPWPFLICTVTSKLQFPLSPLLSRPNQTHNQSLFWWQIPFTTCKLTQVQRISDWSSLHHLTCCTLELPKMPPHFCTLICQCIWSGFI